MEFFTYKDFLLYVSLAVGLGILIFFVSYFFVYRSQDQEKLSAYECGFDPFEASHTNFEVRYFLVALMFIIFDVEISFLFPWAMETEYSDTVSLGIMSSFFYILVVGYIYEWRKDALEFC